MSVAAEGRTDADGSGGLTHHSIYVPVVRRSRSVGGSVGRSADAMVIGVSAMRQLTYVCGGRLEGRTHVGREPTHHVLLRLRAGPENRVGILLCEYNLFTAAVNQGRGQADEGTDEGDGFCPRIPPAFTLTSPLLADLFSDTTLPMDLSWK